MCNCSQEEYQVTFLVPDGDSNLCCLPTSPDQSGNVSRSGDSLLTNGVTRRQNLICILSPPLDSLDIYGLQVLVSRRRLV